MASITSRIRPFDLGEAHRRVQHPLHRLRGYIRLYVALEGVALFALFLSVWFWFSLVMDYGFFKVFGLDWVQEVPRWGRALTLGLFFAAVVSVLQFPTLLPAVGRELRQGLHEAFAVTPRQRVPFWVKLAAGWLGFGIAAVLDYFATSSEAGASGEALVVLAEIILPVLAILGVSFLYYRGEGDLVDSLRSLPVMMWVRAGLGLAGLVAGIFLGGMLGRGMSTHEIAVILGSGIGATLGGMALWQFGSMLYLLVEEMQYRLLAGLPALLAYLMAWFCVGLAADQDVIGSGMTGFLLALLLLGPAAFLAAKRLFHDFHPRALALVLERRFPQILGDRLITAVELANPRETVQFGYSPAMIEETIHEAAQRVEKLPIGEVFNWRRLIRQGATVLVVTVGGYLAAGGLFSLSNAFGGEESGLSGFSQFHDVAAIWGERSLLLENTIWPRRAHLEFLDQFASGDEFKVGRDNAAPTVKVRALKWMLADPKVNEGWRPLYWRDLNAELLGEPAPNVTVPADWAIRDPERGPTLDEIEIRLGKTETHQTLPAETLVALRDVLTRLEDRVKLPKLSRKLRRLAIPETVYVNYWGPTTRSEMTLQRLNENEYEGQFPDLKESVTFRARGEDYYTPNKKILVVPPPSLVRLVRDEYQPAYLYYRGKPEFLRGKKQVRRNLTVSLYGGDTSRIDLPAGSDVVLTATTDKELEPDGVRVLSMEDKRPLGIDVQVSTNDEGQFKVFTTRFHDVRKEIKFIFEFLDTDHVIGRRQVAIKPQEDLPPELEVQVETLRKTPQGYMITPLAQIPLSGVVRDDRGLESIEFAYVLSRSDPADMGGRPLLMVSAMQIMAGGVGSDVLTAACLSTLAKQSKPQQDDEKGKLPLGAFLEKLSRRPGEILPPDEVEKLLDNDLTGKYAQRALLKDFKFDPDDADIWFDLDPNLAAQRYPGRAKLPKSLKAGEGQRQPRYRMQLWLEATDTDILTGPHRGLSKERFTFLIVPEEELLSEIAKEEETHHVKLDEAVRRLREGDNKLTQMKLDLAVVGGLKKDQFGPMSLRCEEIEQTLEKTLTTVSEVYADYQRILRELHLNRIQTVNYVQNIETNIVGRLRDAIDTDFPEADRAVKDLHRLLDLDEPDLGKKNKDARAANDLAGQQLAKLIKRLDEVLAAMEKLTTVNKLIAMLLQIKEGLGTQEAEYHTIKKRIEDDLFKGLETPDESPKKPGKKE